MKRARFVVALAGLAVAAPVSMAIPVPSGQEADASDTRFDAVVAVGRRHQMSGPDAWDWIDPSTGIFDPTRNGRNVGSGTLIAPDVVLTVRHLWTNSLASSGMTLDEYLCGPSESCDDTRKWAVRFRRNPDGTVGTMNEFPIAPATVRGPDSFFHVNIIGAVEFGGTTDSVLLFLENPVTHIEPMPVTGVDERLSFTLGFRNMNVSGESTVSVAFPDIMNPMWFAGWGSTVTTFGVGSGNNQFRFRPGFLRATMFDTWSGHAFDYAPTGHHDSGGPIVVVTGDGELAFGGLISSGGSTTVGWGVSGEAANIWFHHAALSGLIGPLSPFDVTGSADPASPDYGKWDGRVDLTDVLYAAARITQGDPDFDYTSTSNPSLPGYGVPDSVVNSDDLLYFLQEQIASDNAANNWPTLPLPARDADNDGDGRFTANDFTASGMSQAQIDKYDFDADGSIGVSDLVIANHIHDLFGHGILGDINGDGVLDEDDLKDIRDLLQSGDPWDNTPSTSTDYVVQLDDNLDGYMTAYDRRAVAFRLLPGDIGAFTEFDATPTDPRNDLPDFEVTRIERITVAQRLIGRTTLSGNLSYIETSGSGDPASPLWGRPDLDTNQADFKFFLWRHHEVFGPGGYAADPEARARMLPIYDANGDGRFNYADFEYLQALDPLSAEAELWDLNNDGVFTIYDLLSPGPADTQVVFETLFIRGWNQGVVGDYDRSTQPDCCSTYSFCVPLDCVPAFDLAADCGDYDSMFVAINCLSDSLFDGRTFFSDADQGYRFELDADLDGDNDANDRNWIAIQTLGIADINFDGAVDSADATLFASLVSAEDPVADIAAPYGVVDFYDLAAFLTRMNGGVCGLSSIPFDCP